MLIKQSLAQFTTGFNFPSVAKFFSSSKLIAMNPDLGPNPNLREVL